MSKKTLLLILFLFAVTCGLLYLALVSTPYKKQTVSGPTPNPLSVNAHTVLTLAPASASQSSQLTQYTLAVTMNTGENVVNSVQLELAYDPQALTNVTVAPGNFFQQPNTLVSNINTTDGRISYATAEQIDLPGRQGTGVVALISFNIAKDFTNQSTQITFLPKTAIAADRILESVLRKATGYTLTIAPSATPVQSLPATTSAQ